MRDMQSPNGNISSFQQEGPAVESNASDHLHRNELITHISQKKSDQQSINSRVQVTHRRNGLDDLIKKKFLE
jgi:hypothetical protein